MVAGCSEHPATLISRRRSLSAEILHSSNLSNVIHKQPLLLESEGTRSREHNRCARTLRFLQQYRHSNVFPLSIFPIKQKTAFSGFESVRIILETGILSVSNAVILVWKHGVIWIQKHRTGMVVRQFRQKQRGLSCS